MIQWGQGRLGRSHLKRAAEACRSTSQRLFPFLQHDNSLPAASIIIPLLNGPDARLLFQQRATSLRLHPGQVAFPGGFILPGEESWHAATRECKEELGWQPEERECLGELGYWYNRKARVKVVPWLVLLDPHVNDMRPTTLAAMNERVNKEEVDHLLLVRLDDLTKKEYKKLHDGWPPVPFFYPDAQHTIWGFTGFVLDAFLQELCAE